MAIITPPKRLSSPSPAHSLSLNFLSSPSRDTPCAPSPTTTKCQHSSTTSFSLEFSATSWIKCGFWISTYPPTSRPWTMISCEQAGPCQFWKPTFSTTKSTPVFGWQAIGESISMAKPPRRSLGAHHTLPPAMIVIIAALGLRAGGAWHKWKDEALAAVRTRAHRVLTKDAKILLQYPWAGTSTMTS